MRLRNGQTDLLKQIAHLHSAIGYVTPQEADEASYESFNVDEKAV